MKRFLILFLALCFVTPFHAARAQSNESCSTTSGLCWPKLKRNASGEKVRTLQILLHSRGFRVAADGQFGVSTESALRSFQKQKHLRVDGLVGWQTWEAVVPTLKLGARGAAVSLFQKWLVARKYPVKRDGVFGQQTRGAVQTLQKDIALVETIDGIAQTTEWCYLLGGHFDGE